MKECLLPAPVFPENTNMGATQRSSFGFLSRKVNVVATSNLKNVLDTELAALHRAHALKFGVTF